MHLCGNELFDFCATINTSFPDPTYEWEENGSSAGYDLCDETSINETTTFTLTVTATSEDNLISNGDFSGGDSGFSTDYFDGQAGCVHGAGYLGCEGAYNVLDDPSDGHTNFSACGDLSGDGNMMVVNGAGSLQEIWCQDVCVDPNSGYLFSAWATSVNPVSPAQLQFSIDGNLIGNTFELSGSLCNWEQFEAEWQASGETSVEICVTNQNTAPTGNDFALDEIEFFQVCSEVMEFTVTFSDVEIDYNDPEPISCIQPTSQVDIFIDANTNVADIEWDTPDGNITGLVNGDETALVDAAGTYMVTVTDEFGCTFTEDIFVDDFSFIPSLMLFPDGVLDCQNSEIEIEAISSAHDPEYIWEDEDGNFLDDNDELDVTSPGIYFVTVTDEDNGCTNYTQIEIEQNNDLPTFDLSSSNDLNCLLSTSTLSLDMPFTTVTWASDVGVPISTTDDVLVVNNPGSYYATVNDNGCIFTDTVVVAEILPNFVFQESQSHTIITCADPEATLGVVFDDTLFDLTWTGTASGFGSAQNIMVTSAGTYNYTLTDSIGCTTTGVFTLTENLDPPEVFASATELDCNNTSASVNLTWTPNIVLVEDVIWTLPDGSTMTAGVRIDVTAPGIVGYEAISTVNGCRTTGTIEVLATGDFPDVAIISTPLTCANPSSNISAVSTDDIATYTWTFPDGTQMTGPTVVTDQLGLHRLEVVASNGCTVSMEEIVMGFLTGPVISIFPDVVLTCEMPSTTVDAGDIPYDTNWSTPNGSTTDTSVVVDTPGTYTLIITDINGCTADTDFQVSLDNATPSGQVATEILTCDNPSFTPILDIDPALPVARIEWDTPVGTVTTTAPNLEAIDINTPGDHTATFFADNGCSSQFSFEVTQSVDLPDITLDASTIDCNNTSSLITLSTNDVLQEIEFLSGSQSLGTGTEVTVDGFGEVRVRVTDTNGCISFSSITPPADTLPIDFLLVTNDLGCQTNGVNITITGTTGTIEHTELYDDQGTLLGDAATIITEPGRYSIIAFGENGCPSTEEFTIDEDAATVDFTVEPLTLDCNIRSSEIEILTLQEYASIIVTDASGTEVDRVDFPDLPEISVEGSYTVTVINTNGCPSEQTLEVSLDASEVAFSLESTILDCNNLNSEITIMSQDDHVGGVLLNEDGEELTTIDTTTISTSVNAPGLYTVMLEGLNGCPSEASIVVMQDSSTVDFTLAAGLINCRQDPVSLSLSEWDQDFDEAWLVEASTQEQTDIMGTETTVTRPGLYTVFVTSAQSGCPSSREIEVEEISDVPTASTFSVETLTCDGAGQLTALVVDGGLSPYDVIIDGVAQEGPSYEVSDLGQHSLSITDANGCRLDTNFVLDPIPDLEVSTLPDIKIVEGAELQLAIESNKDLSELDISWSPADDLSCSDCPMPFFTGLEDTEYVVTVEDAFGCVAEAAVRISLVSVVSIYLPNIINLNSEENRFTLYTGRGDISQVRELRVYDRWGNLLFLNEEFAPNLTEEGWDGTYKGSPVLAGVYTYMTVVEFLDGTTKILAGDLTVLR